MGYETERLILRVSDETFVNAVVDYYIRNKHFLEEWEAKQDENCFTPEVHIRQLRQDAVDIQEGRLLRLWILKKDTAERDRIIGTLSFSNIVRGCFLSCFVGYKLDKDEINKGYMTEALRKGIDIAFHELGLHRLEANIMPKNKRSLRVVEKLGFKHEGLASQYLKINGVWEDHIHMVLLNSDKLIQQG